MKLYISIDIEGIAGVPSWMFGSRKNKDYEIGRDLMVGELNAAIEGALEAGVKEIIVNDSHGDMTNMNPVKVHKAARLLQGERKPWSMMEGMGPGIDAVAFIGYHAMAGSMLGNMCHTYCGAVTEAKLNGELWGEAELNGAFAGTFGTPLVFASGDEALAEEVKRFFPGIEAVAVKKAYGMRAALSDHPEIAREKIKEGMKKAIEKRDQIKPFRPESPCKLECMLREPDMADVCSRIPGTKRLSGKIISYEHEEYREIYRAFLSIMSMAANT